MEEGKNILWCVWRCAQYLFWQKFYQSEIRLYTLQCTVRKSRFIKVQNKSPIFWYVVKTIETYFALFIQCMIEVNKVNFTVTSYRLNKFESERCQDPIVERNMNFCAHSRRLLKNFVLLCISFLLKWNQKANSSQNSNVDNTQCARTDLNKRFSPKPMNTTGWKGPPRESKSRWIEILHGGSPFTLW